MEFAVPANSIVVFIPLGMRTWQDFASSASSVGLEPPHGRADALMPEHAPLAAHARRVI
jgi:hypothetical protein